MACHNSVPTLFLLNHRNIALTATCSRCNLHAETFLHCVRDCHHSIRIWHHCGFNDPNFLSDMIDHDWLKDGLMGPHCYLFADCLWWAWCHRNNLCFSNETLSIHHLSFNIQSMVENFKACFKPTSNGTLKSRLIKWNNNNFSSVILNVDDSCLGSPIRADFGGLLRTNDGLYLSGFSRYIHNSTDILQVELLVIFQDLLLAKTMNIDELVCYSDSLHGINLITGPPMKHHVRAVLIQDIKDLIEQSNITICHTLRERNQCADFIANLGAIHSSPPNDIMSLFKIDVVGTFSLEINSCFFFMFPFFVVVLISFVTKKNPLFCLRANKI